MHKQAIFLTLLVLALTQTQEYLPKDGNITWNDLIANNIARAGDNDFWKVDENGHSIIVSAYPIRPNSITKVKFYVVYGVEWVFGIGKIDNISNTCTGCFPNSVGYHGRTG